MKALEFLEYVLIFAIVTFSKHLKDKSIEQLEVRSEFGSDVGLRVELEIWLEFELDIDQKLD